MSEMSCDEYPVRTGKKNLRGKDGGCRFPREFVTLRLLRVAQHMHIWLYPISMEPCDSLNVR